MVAFVFETVEGFAEGEVADYVEGHPVVPIHQIDRALARAVHVAMQSADQVIHLGLKQGLLLPQSLVGKGMAQQPRDASVVDIVGREDTVDAGEEGRVFLEILVTLAVRVDVFPSRGAIEGEFVGAGADDVAVVAVIQVF